MRNLALGETDAGLIAWDSFFHLSPDEQRSTIPRLARHVAPGGALLVTVGPSASEKIGSVGGDPVYHASLSIAEHEERLREVGLEVEDFVPEDPGCAGRSVLFAVRPADSSPRNPTKTVYPYVRAADIERGAKYVEARISFRLPDVCSHPPGPGDSCTSATSGRSMMSAVLSV
jgi:hypothetical protein